MMSTIKNVLLTPFKTSEFADYKHSIVSEFEKHRTILSTSQARKNFKGLAFSGFIEFDHVTSN